jgi:predicted esterase
MTDGFKNVYVVEVVDQTANFHSIVGIYEAEGLAEMARRVLEGRLTEDDLDVGIAYRITSFEIGKIYG